MKTQRVIALLGRKDEPTDAVAEYCSYLGAALTAHHIRLEIQPFPWEKIGWPLALAQLEKSAMGWRGQHILVQYTALAWSARGFPGKFLRVLEILKSAHALINIVFHDVEPFPGTRWIDRLRRSIQIRTMRKALSIADGAVFTVPPEKLSWLIDIPANATFIPVGPNLPILAAGIARVTSAIPTIGVFSITGGDAGARETKRIIAAVSYASQALGRLRLSIFGRHAELREAELRQGLQNFQVEISVEGVIDPEQVVHKLSVCDLLLFVRGPISSRRSSAIAAIACGLPIIAFSGSETAAPVTEAGVLLVPYEQPDRIQAVLVRVLSDASLRAELASRSRTAYELYFSWSVIGVCFATLLKT
jgi:glycosyltransferase involved in cell wall biosynthesis